MKYEIVFFSKTGNTEKAAAALASVLPADEVRMVRFPEQTPSPEAEVFLIGFGVYRVSCPFELLDFMSSLSGKTILLFGTAGISAAEPFMRHLESTVLPFLPDNCTYLGMRILPGKITQEGFDYFCRHLQATQKPEELQNLNGYREHQTDIRIWMNSEVCKNGRRKNWRSETAAAERQTHGSRYSPATNRTPNVPGPQWLETVQPARVT